MYVKFTLLFWLKFLGGYKKKDKRMVRKTKEEAQETRNDILDAAEKMFLEHGVSRTTLAEIATAAGVTRGAVYWHFANKFDLFEGMLKRVFDPIEALLGEWKIGAEENPVDRLRAMALYFIDRVATDQRMFRILEISWHKCEYVGEMAAIRDAHLECGNRHMAIIEEAFRLAREREYLPATLDPRCAAVGLIVAMDGLVLNWTFNKTRFPLKQYGPLIIDAYLKGLKDC